MKKKVDILGVQYTILYNVKKKNLPKYSDGCMDQSMHTIKIAKIKPSRDSLEDLKEYIKKIVRHEIVHAFLYESGIWNNSECVTAWGQNETITDWIAIQSPKLLKAFEEADCL